MYLGDDPLIYLFGGGAPSEVTRDQAMGWNLPTLPPNNLLPVGVPSSAVDAAAVLQQASSGPMIQSAEAAGVRQFGTAAGLKAAVSQLNPQMILYAGAAIVLVLLLTGAKRR